MSAIKRRGGSVVLHLVVTLHPDKDPRHAELVERIANAKRGTQSAIALDLMLNGTRKASAEAVEEEQIDLSGLGVKF